MILGKDRLNEFVSLLQREKSVIAPTINEGDVQFREISDPEEVTLDYSRTSESIKKYILPQTEMLFSHKINENEVSIFTPKRENSPRILFGIRPCDLHAARQMKLVYRSYEPIVHERIENTIFICLNCNSVCSDTSFCSSMNTGPFYHGENADIVLTDLGKGLFVEGRTEIGTSLMTEANELFAAPEYEINQKMDRIEEKVISEQNISFDPAKIGYVMNEDDPIWDEKARYCFRCGGCNFVCPTCVCYDVVDRGEIRERSWDSCLMSGFTILASGDNPRGKLSQRIAHRYLHKFVYTKIQSDTYSCVGCGRCTDVCLFGDNMGQTIADMMLLQPKKSRHKLIGMKSIAKTKATRSEETMIPHIGTLVEKVSITENDALFTIALPEPMVFEPGQFVEIGAFGFGEIPISIASSRLQTDRNIIEIVVRNVGKVTQALHHLALGSSIGIRGPYGTSWPMNDAVGKHVHIIAGGIGLCPLRGAIIELLEKKSELKSFDLFYGARNPSQIIFKDDLKEWGRDICLYQTVDTISEHDEWSGDVGLITQYFKPENGKHTIPFDDALVFICGPVIMIKNVCKSLEELGCDDKNIYVSLEAMMKCGIGSCGHCSMGELHICKDGPVFSLHQLKGIHCIKYPF